MPETITWLDPDGVATVLTDPPLTKVLDGRAGAFMPPVAFVEDTVPLQDGARLRLASLRPREVDLPFYVQAATTSALRTRLRSLMRTFDPTRGEGTLRVQVDAQTERDLHCRYAGGLELSEASQVNGRIWQKAVLTFRAPDPFWYGRNAIVVTYELDDSVATFFPFFPLRLATSTVFADAVVDVDTDVEAWPQWTITGPGSGLVLSNLTTDERLELSRTLAAGETVTIDTRPGYKTVTLNDGTNLFPNLTSDSSLWALQVGSNSVRVELSSGTAASSVVLSYLPRFLSP